MMTEKEQKNAEGFVCKYCDFTCFKKSNFDKHLLTRKHKIVTNDYEKMPKMPNHIYFAVKIVIKDIMFVTVYGIMKKNVFNFQF